MENHKLADVKYSFPGWMAGALGLVLISVIVGGAWFYHTQEKQLHQAAEQRLQTISQMKITQIDTWLDQRMGDAAVLCASSFLTAGIERWLDAPDSPGLNNIQTRFRAMRENYHYSDILLSDPDGAVRLSSTGNHQSYLHAEAIGFLATAFREKRPVLIDLHLDPVNRTPRFGIIAPFFARTGDIDRPAGAIILLCDARQFLYPLIQAWPTPSRSAETLLVRRDGDSVLFLNDLRHKAGTALTLRIPLDHNDIPAVMAVSGKVGVVEGIDYREIKVMAVLGAVPGTPWFMVAKLDAVEVMEEWRQRSAFILTLILLLIATVIATGGMIWQRNRKAYYRALTRAWDALRESEENHRTTLLSVGDAVISTDGKGRVALMNPVAEALTGWNQDEAKGRHLSEIFNIVNEQTREKVESPVVRVLREGVIVGLANHTLLVARDGTERPIADSGAPIRTQGGDVSGVVLVFRDQSEERAAQMVRQESEERYRSLVEHAPDAILVNQSNKVTLVNQACIRLFGAAGADELLEKTPFELFHPRYHALIRERIKHLHEAGLSVPPIEEKIIRLDGKIIDVEVSAAPFSVGGINSIHVILRDITERKQAETLIQHLNRVLRSVRGINQLIVRERDREKLIQRACNLLVEHRSYTGAMTVLTDENERPVTYAQAGMGEAFRALAEKLDRGELPLCCEGAMQANGVFMITERKGFCDPCPIAAACQSTDSMIARLLHDGNTLGYLAVSLDKNLGTDSEEQELFAEMAGDLAFALHTMKMEEARDQGEEERRVLENQLLQAQKLETVGRLAGGVAHDFNNMLSVIIGYTELALAKSEPESPLTPSLHAILEAGERSAELTRQLLAFARKQPIQPTVLDLNSSIEEVLRMLGRLVGEDIDLLWKPTDVRMLVKMDPAQLDQIFTNLVINARDAIAGVGKITIETNDVGFDEKHSESHYGFLPGHYVQLTVSDNGIGMDRETQAQIFEPFFTTKPQGEGTGLGLSTVYGIVKQNNGFINVYSELGQGTTFRIYLPKHEEEVRKENEGRRSLTKTNGPATVLLVEDEGALLKLSSLLLEKLGYAVLAAATPNKALQLAREYDGEIHLLLTDVVMPEMNGRELWMRLNELRPQIKCLFTSGYTANVILHQGVLDKNVHFLAKPFSVEELAEKVRGALDG